MCFYYQTEMEIPKFLIFDPQMEKVVVMYRLLQIGAVQRRLRASAGIPNIEGGG